MGIVYGIGSSPEFARIKAELCLPYDIELDARYERPPEISKPMIIDVVNFGSTPALRL